MLFKNITSNSSLVIYTQAEDNSFFDLFMLLSLQRRWILPSRKDLSSPFSKKIAQVVGKERKNGNQ
jgi:hypothetical protein